MITAKDLEAIEKIRTLIAELGYTGIRVDLLGIEREYAPISMTFCQESAQTQEGGKG
jgi:hypothetical protein